ncbi:hypothetical protein V8F06_010176 [Rhypophila decipiens]
MNFEPQMSSYKRDDWSQPSFPPNRSTSHRPLTPLPTSRRISNKLGPPLPSAMKGHTHTPLPPLPANRGRSHIMKPLPAVPSAMNQKPLPALPPVMNVNMASGNRRRNSPRRVSFSNIKEDDSRPRFRNPKDQTYPRGCLNHRSAPAPAPAPAPAKKHVSPVQPRTTPSASSERVVPHGKPNHVPGERCKDLTCSTCKAKIADWISDTSERIALDEGMPPETLSISAFQRVFYEDEDTACDFKNQTTAEAITQLTGGNEFETNNATQEGVITQIMRIIALSLCQKVEDPYEVHARKRAERRMKRILSGRDLDEDNKKRRRRKRSSADSVDISVKTFFVPVGVTQPVGVYNGAPSLFLREGDPNNRHKEYIFLDYLIGHIRGTTEPRDVDGDYDKDWTTYLTEYVRLRNHTTTAPRPPRKFFAFVGQTTGKEEKKDEDKATEDPTKDVTRKGEEDQDEKKETEKKETEKKDTERKDTEKKETEEKETEKKETVDRKEDKLPKR